jgi:plasmid stability protein
MPDLALRGLTRELHEALKTAAARNHRSLNGEILARLEASMAGATVDVDALLARIGERRKRIDLGTLDAKALRKLKRAGRS